jgi:lipopolysaccharide transport system permease protein
VYLPRAIFPLGNMSPAFFDAAIRMAVLIGTIAVYAVKDGTWYVIAGPGLLLSAMALAGALMLAVAISMFTSVWGESTRDMRYTIAQVLPVWFVVTPVLYPLSSVPANLRPWMTINPMTPFVETFRWGLLGVGQFDPARFATAFGVSAVLLLAGFFYFARVDRRAAEAR